jgi:ATP-dependent 26S proteasome regulatory subunit
VKGTLGDGIQSERDVQRTLLELLNQPGEFSLIEDVKVMADGRHNRVGNAK